MPRPGPIDNGDRLGLEASRRASKDSLAEEYEHARRHSTDSTESYEHVPSPTHAPRPNNQRQRSFEAMSASELRKAAAAERRERRRAAALFRVTKVVSESDGNSSKLVQRLLEVAREILYCSHVTLFWVDHVSEILIAANPDGIESIEVPLGKGVAGKCALDKVLLNIVDASSDDRFDNTTDKETGFSTRTILCAPVVEEGRTVAVIEALNKEEGAFDDEDVELLQLLCDELRAPLRRAAADETFAARANSAERGVAYLKLFTDEQEEPSTPVQTTPHVLSFDADDGHYSRDSSMSDEPLGELASWRWDALRVADGGGEEALVSAAETMFEHHGSLEQHDCPRDQFRAFLRMVRSSYKATNSYHNFRHAVAVLHVDFMLACRAKRARDLTALDVLALKVAALCHDVDHPGHSNDFEVKSSSELALRYNDASVLENYHASFVFATLLRNPSTDFLTNLSRASYREFRKAVISMILATDMARHGSHVDSLRAFADRTSFTSLTRHSFSQSDSDADSRVASPRRRQFYLDQLIHLGDMSAQCSPCFETAKDWAERIAEEFRKQAAREQELGLQVSPFMARLETAADLALGQVAFIDYVVQPLFAAAQKIFPEVSELEANCRSNREAWRALGARASADRASD